MVHPCPALELCPAAAHRSGQVRISRELNTTRTETTTQENTNNSYCSQCHRNSSRPGYTTQVVVRSASHHRPREFRYSRGEEFDGKDNKLGPDARPCHYFSHESGETINQERLGATAFVNVDETSPVHPVPTLIGVWSEHPSLKICRREEREASTISIYQQQQHSLLTGCCPRPQNREYPRGLLKNIGCQIWRSPSAFLFFILVFMSSTLTSSPRVVYTQATAAGPQDLNLGILVAESCSNDFITQAERSAQDAIRAFYAAVNASESSPGTVRVSADTYPYCGTKEIIASLDPILSNTTIQVVLALTSYQVHASFLPLAELYQKAYVALNVFLPTASFEQSASAFPSFSQMSLMLARLLDEYRWESVFVVQSNYKKWDDFANKFYFKMSSLEFQVTLGDILEPPTDEASALAVLRQVEKRHKG